jgi:uncharacterized LabA/DUF88 family protein
VYTCSRREGQIPNYKNIIDLIDEIFPDNVKMFYHVGEGGTKRGICNFLTKIGVDYNIVFDFDRVSKPQLIASQMAIDSMKCMSKAGVDDIFVFFTGDDYLIPIVEELSKFGAKVKILYFPAILSIELDSVLKQLKIPLKMLSNRFFTYPRKK